jgi:hypothetical protein
MTRPEPDPPEVAREGTKGKCDPESNNPYSSSRQRFVEPIDKLPKTATAWDKIHIFADMDSNKMIQCVQPFRMKKPDENEKGEYDEFYGSSADHMIRSMTEIHNIAEDGVAFKSLIFDPYNQPPGQFQKHGQATEMVKLNMGGVFVTDDFAEMMPSDHNFVKNVMRSNDPPLNISRSKGDQWRQLETLTEGVHDVHHQKFTLSNHEITSPVDTTYKSVPWGSRPTGSRPTSSCLTRPTSCTARPTMTMFPARVPQS